MGKNDLVVIIQVICMIACITFSSLGWILAACTILGFQVVVLVLQLIDFAARD